LNLVKLNLNYKGGQQQNLVAATYLQLQLGVTTTLTLQ